MKVFGRGLDFGISVVACLGFGFAAFAFGSVFISRNAGALLAATALVLAVAYVAGSFLEERRTLRLAAGLCPRCEAAVTTEHVHRRWDSASQQWLQPQQTWECRSCGFEHSVRFVCPQCPEGT